MTRRRPRLDDIVTRGGLTRREVEQGYILATPEQNRAFALGTLRASRDAEHDAPIFPDGEITIDIMANTAGVYVEYIHVDLTTGTVERREVDGRAVQL
jgi:hypothetical protein